MFKKPGQLLLLIITILFTGIMVGVLIGRQTTDHDTYLSADATPTSVCTQPTQTESDLPGKLNINFATAEELAMLPGLGDTSAQRIVEYRELNGPYLTIEDLLNVKGIGQTRFESISKYITVGG